MKSSVKTMKFLTKYNHASPVSPSGGVSMTDPQFASECDINLIIDRYQKTGIVPPTRNGSYGDFTKVGDFSDALERVRRAETFFDGLPAVLRARFGNDLTTFCDFALNPDNLKECISLGIFDNAVDGESALDVLKDIRTGVTASAASPAPNGDGITA